MQGESSTELLNTMDGRALLILLLITAGCEVYLRNIIGFSICICTQCRGVCQSTCGRCHMKQEVPFLSLVCPYTRATQHSGTSSVAQLALVTEIWLSAC